jgi:hypothetical protein
MKRMNRNVQKAENKGVRTMGILKIIRKATKENIDRFINLDGCKMKQ